MILVTDATGTIGGQVVEGLLKRSPAPRLGERPCSIEGRGFLNNVGTGSKGDFTDPASLNKAFEGTE